jgi:hypothetical protein
MIERGREPENWLTQSGGSRPSSAEVEISVFGPGYGESIALHIGRGRWAIIDSCVLQPGSRPVALHYLAVLGVKPEESVDLVVATHWHDDHIRGIADVFRACTSADFAISAALREREFRQLLATYEGKPFEGGSGLTELSAIVKELANRGRPPRFAIHSRRLLQDSNDGEIWALSPSDEDITLAIRQFAKLLPDKGSLPRASPVQPNRASVALWVRRQGLAVLLGADLEQTPEANTGWTAVVSSTTRPKGVASLFKVPHHGSHTAHNAAVWTDMLIEPTSVLTPWARGRRYLPTDSDVDRIVTLSKVAFSTAPPARRKAELRDPAVRRTVKETTKSFLRALPDMGMVRFRSGDGKVWTRELFGSAAELSS